MKRPELEEPLLVAKWDSRLPPRKYLPNGDETTYSRLARMARASELEKQAEAADPHLAAENAQRRAQTAAEQAKADEQAEVDRFWAATPLALRAMGVGFDLANELGGLETYWPGVQAVDAWAKSDELFLVLGGQGGTGKTFAACRALFIFGKEEVRTESYRGSQWRPGWAKFTHAGPLARLSYYDKNDRQFLHRLENARLLVVDELGGESMSEPWKATLLELLDKRMTSGFRTVLTTNLSGEALTERYDARVMRRLKDRGTFVAVKPHEKAVGT